MSGMKQSFRQVAPESYETREKRLQEAADAIEKQLSANQNPQPKLQPKGAIRAAGDAIGRNAAQERKMSIEDELAQIRKERAQAEKTQGHTPPPPDKGKSLA